MDSFCAEEDYWDQMFAPCRKRQYLRDKEEYNAEQKWEEARDGECNLNISGMRIEEDT